MTDTERLSEIIEKSGLRKGFIAEKLGISRQALSKKLSGASGFSQSQISILKDCLSMTPSEVDRIFFAS